MNDTQKLADLIRRAEDTAEAPGGETGVLLKEAAHLLLPSEPSPTVYKECEAREARYRIHELVEWQARREAAMVLMEAVLPGWEWTKQRHNKITVLRHSPFLVFDAENEDLARALLIATLKATEARG